MSQRNRRSGVGNPTVLLASVLVMTPACGGGEDDDATEHDGDAAACDARAEPEEAAPQICDGSDSIRLSVVVAGDLGRVSGDQVLLYENGFRFLHVRGDCRYWVSRGYGRYHTGMLGELETNLAKAVAYGRWNSACLTASWGPPPSVFDASSTLFSDGRNFVAITYTGDGVIEGAPPEVFARIKI